MNVLWKPYELSSQLPKNGGVDKRQRYIERFGAESAKRGAARLKSVGAECVPAIKFEFDGLIGNTFDSHRLVNYAEQFGKANECIEVIMNYYFELNKDISSHKVLIEIGQKIGLSVEL